MDEDSYDRIIKLIRETVIMLCKNGVHYNRQLRVQGLIGVTIDDGKSVFLVHMNDCVHGDDCSSADSSKPAQSSVEAEASSRPLDDVVNEQYDTEECHWSKTLETSASQYSCVKQEREASRTNLHGESQNAADNPASLTSNVVQNKFWDQYKDDDVICIESVSDKTYVGSSSASPAVWNPYHYSVPSAVGHSDSSATEICQIAKTQGRYAPTHSDTAQYSESLGVKTEYGKMGVTHHLSTPKSQSSGIGSSQHCSMVLLLLLLLLLLLHPFSGLFFQDSLVSQHQKGKPFWILMKREIMRW